MKPVTKNLEDYANREEWAKDNPSIAELRPDFDPVAYVANKKARIAEYKARITNPSAYKVSTALYEPMSAEKLNMRKRIADKLGITMEELSLAFN